MGIRGIGNRTMWRAVGSCIWALAPLAVLAADPTVPEPARIVIECEDMRGVAQDRFGPGPGWRVGRWGHDLLQNMVFGGAWASRLRTAMTDATEQPADIDADFDVPADGRYMVWVKYECPPHFNYAFGVKIEPAANGAPALDTIYGLRDSPKHFNYRNDLHAGDQYWSWGIDHDAAEGHEVKLTKGRHKITISKRPNPTPAGPRSLDAILITSDLSPVSSPRYSRYPLLDELRRANQVYFRFRNPAGAAGPVLFNWNHWNHRYDDFYGPGNRNAVRFFAEGGRPLEGGKDGDWTEATEPGAASPWYDLGPTMNTESTSPYLIGAHAPGGKTDGPSLPVEVDIALEPNAGKILGSFALSPGEPALGILVQPDLHRPEGVALTKKITDVYAELTGELEAQPRLGPVPKRLRLIAATGWPLNGRGSGGGAWDFESGMAFRRALGLNSLVGPPEKARAMLAWDKARGAIVERSLSYHHSQEIPPVVKWVRDGGVENQFHYLSFGDEIGLPNIDGKDAAKVSAFRDFVKRHGETPASLGLAGWDMVKPLAALSGEVAVRIGVLPEASKSDAASLASLKRLYWYSCEFQAAEGIASFAEKTRALRAALGAEVQTTANLGSMHPFYWMHQASFIEAFKHEAMSLAWSEDYTYCMPEASRLVAEFQAAYLRKGASYHDTPMMWYCMPHWPGNNPEQLLQNVVLEWGQNVKDLDFFHAGPDVWSTENYIAYRGGLPVWKAIRTISGMAGLIEDHLLPARTEPARIAVLLSEASDLWETEGRGQGAVAPGTIATNVSQEERKAIWYALRYAGHRVDHVTEKDCADGLLANYKALYVCGQNLERKAAAAVREWVRAGGTIFATAGAARKDEFDAPLTALDEVLGRGAAVNYERYRGPLRARLELLFVKPLDEMRLGDGRALPVYCSREEFEPAGSAEVVATYENGEPASITTRCGAGRGFYTGTLPGQAWVKAALPVLPQGKGGPHTAAHMTEWLGHDAVASDVILAPLAGAAVVPDVVADHRGVVTGRLKSDRSTVITVVNLALEADGRLEDVKLRIADARPVKRAWSCFHADGNLCCGAEDGTVIVKLPSLGPADVIILEH